MQPIDAPHVENVMAALQVRAEHLFVVTKPVMALPGQKEKGHGLASATIGFGLSPPDVRVCKGHATFRLVPESWEV